MEWNRIERHSGHNRQDIGANQVELNAQVTGNTGNLVTIASELTEI